MSDSGMGKSRMADLTDAGIHYVDYGGEASGPAFVLVHGLGGSHLNWDLLAPELTPVGRVYAVDLPGFGLSGPTGRPATVGSNVDILGHIIQHVSNAPVVLVGNSMGGLISILLAADRPELIHGLVLIDPALPAPKRVFESPRELWNMLAYALPGVGERRRRAVRHRIGARAALSETLAMGGVDESTLPPDLIERNVAVVARESDVAGMDRAYLSASRSLAWALARVRRYHAAMSAVVAPVLLLHGDQDRLIPVDAARTTARHHPGWHYIEVPGGGHAMQLQQPHTVAVHLLTWLSELPADRRVTGPNGGTCGDAGVGPP